MSSCRILHTIREKQGLYDDLEYIYLQGDRSDDALEEVLLELAGEIAKLREEASHEQT